MPSSKSIVSVLVAICASIFYALRYSMAADAAEVPWNQWPFHYLTDRTGGDDSWNVMHHQGGNSPWFQKTGGVVEGGLTPPGNCTVDQIHMVSRHAERYPTLLSGGRMLMLYNRIQEGNVSFDGSLEFASSWQFLTPDPDPPDVFFENLVSTGAYAGTLEAFNAGHKLRERYRQLLTAAVESSDDGQPINFWSSPYPRVIDTARYFAAGFFGSEWEKQAQPPINSPWNNAPIRSSYPAKLNIIPSDPAHGANTLTPGKNCPVYYNPSSSETDEEPQSQGRKRGAEALAEWRSHFLPPIIARLEAENPHFPLYEDEVYAMMELCGFDTIATGAQSPWCDVFTRSEWDAFEYARDVLHYYRTGPGNTFSELLGRGWTNATAELLQSGPEKGNVFLSFAHDTDLLAIMSYILIPPNSTTALPTTHIPPNRTFHTSSLVPMGGRLLLERLSCPLPQECWSNAPFYPNHVYCSPLEYAHYVRVNVNDGIIAIPGCNSGPGESCPLGEFVGMVRERGEKLGASFAEMCGLPVEETPEGVTFLHQ